MKKVFLYIFTIAISSAIFSQDIVAPDTLYAQYKNAAAIQDKAAVITDYFIQLSKADLDTKTASLMHSLDFFRKKNDVWGTCNIQLGISRLYMINGDYKQALEYALPTVQSFEKLNDTVAIVNSLRAVGDIFEVSQNFEKGLSYYKRGKDMAEIADNGNDLSTILNGMARCYNQMNLPDSALPLIQRAVNIAEQEKNNEVLGGYYATLGETYMAKNEHDIARPYLFKGFNIALSQGFRLPMANISNDVAESFFSTGNYTDAIASAQNAVVYASPEFKKQMMTAYEWIYKSYEQTDHDSVYKYFRLAMETKDTLFTIEKNKSIEALDLQEQLRLQDVQAKQAIAAEERSKNIQYALISLGIILLIAAFLLLSRSFITNTRLIRFIGVLALLIVFEFLNLLLHPFLESITGHSLVLMLLALVVVAAILVPLHHTIEKWAIEKIVEKNKAVRLAQAKKTIEQLEEKK